MSLGEVRAAAGEPARVAETAPASKGRLIRPSNPLHRNPVKPQQRRLPAKTTVRDSAYDLDASPEHVGQPLKRRWNGPQGFSPTKKQKQAAKHTPKTAPYWVESVLNEDVQRAIDAQLDVEPDTEEKAADVGRSTPNLGATQIPEAQFRDYFPDLRAFAGERDKEHCDNATSLQNRVEQVAEDLSDAVEEQINEHAAVDQRVPHDPRGRRKGKPRKGETHERSPKSPSAETRESDSKAIKDAQEEAKRAGGDEGRTVIGVLVPRTKAVEDGTQIEVQAQPDSEAAKALLKPPRSSSSRATWIANSARADRERRKAEKDLLQLRRSPRKSTKARNPRAVTDGEEVDPAQARDRGPTPNKGPARPKIAQVRVSDLYGPGASIEMFSPSPQKQPQASQRRRVAAVNAQSSAILNKQRTAPVDKEPLFVLQAQDAEPESTESMDDQVSVDEGGDSTRDESVRYYGQWPILKRVFRGVDQIGVQYQGGEACPKRKFSVENPKVKAVLEACDEALNAISDGDEVAANLAEVAMLVEELYMPSEDNEVDFSNGVIVKDIYAHVFAKLVHVLQALLERYEKIDGTDGTVGAVNMGHLRTINTFVNVITELGEGAKKFTARPTELGIIRPCEHLIYVPLRDSVYPSFQRVISDHDCIMNMRRREREQLQRRQEEEEREEQEARQKAQIRSMRARWQALHVERMWAEREAAGLYIPDRKFRRLQTPHYDIDSNGQEFERVEAMAPRLGPPPGLVDAARNKVWPRHHVNALLDGLAYFTDDEKCDRLTKIIRALCGKGGPLSEYTVTEIVVMCADLREWLMQTRLAEQKEVEPWILNIPVWTRGWRGTDEENQEYPDADDDEA